MSFPMYQLKTIILSLLAVMVLQSFGSEAQSCFDPLGMEDGTIKASQITVSSIYLNTNRGNSARLRKNLPSWGAWCPKKTNEEKIKYDDYIQINLLYLTKVRKVATQGRELARGVEYTKTYQISYSFDGKIWFYYKKKDSSETKIFNGNVDVRTVVENKIDPPIFARYVRIHPGNSNITQVCLRLELYGCTWILFEQGILSYSMPEGQVTPNGNIVYRDTNYTGIKTGGILSGGTGLLTDGEIGPVYSKLYGGKGWVGWKQANPTGPQNVNITFEFDFERKFSSVTITVNIRKPHSSLFNKSRIFVSKKEDDFSLSSALQYCPEQVQTQAEMENLNVNLSLCDNVGKFVRIQLYPEGKWLLISEIKFKSVPVFENTTTFQTCFDGDYSPCFHNIPSYSPSLNTILSYSPSLNTTLSCAESSSSHLLYILIALVCVFCVIGLVVIALLLTRRKSKQSNLNQEVSLEIMRAPTLNNDHNDVPEAATSSNQIPNNGENQPDDVEEGYECPFNTDVTPHHPTYTALMKRTKEEDHDYQKLIKSSGEPSDYQNLTGDNN